MATITTVRNVRMIQRGSHPRFALEASLCRGIGQVVGQELDRHRPFQLGVERAVDHPHAAFAERTFDAVRTKLLPVFQYCKVTQTRDLGNLRSRVITVAIAGTWSGHGANAATPALGFANFFLNTTYSGTSGAICATYIGPGNLSGSSSGASDSTKIYTNVLYK